MYNKFIDGLLLKFAYKFVQVLGTSYRYKFFSNFFFQIFSPILDFEKLPLILWTFLKSVCAQKLSIDSYQMLHKNLSW